MDGGDDRKEKEFRDGLIVGPSVTEIARAFFNRGANVESAVEESCEEMLALVRPDHVNLGDVKY